MSEILSISPLGAVPWVIPTVAQWFEEEWAPYYGPGGPGEARADLTSWCTREALPVALMALDPAGEPLGIVALKEEGLGSHLGLGPWLSALYVAKSQRRLGVGSILIKSAARYAESLGVRELYAASDAVAPFFTRAGWMPLDTRLPSLRGEMPVYRHVAASDS